jgi:hypothetical protein
MLTPVAPSTSNINDRLQCRRHLKAEEVMRLIADIYDRPRVDFRNKVDKGYGEELKKLALPGNARLDPRSRSQPSSTLPGSIVPQEKIHGGHTLVRRPSTQTKPVDHP